MAKEESSKPEWANFTLNVKGMRLLATASRQEELKPFLTEVKNYRPECEYTIGPLSPELAQKKGYLRKMWQKGHRFSLWQITNK